MSWFGNPMFGCAVTLGAYGAALALRRRVGWAHPLVVTVGVVIAVLVAGRIPESDYQVGGAVLKWFLGPATVALAVPLYRRVGELYANQRAILGSVVAGGVSAMGTSWSVVGLLGGERSIALAMLSRSVTTPISIGIARELGARPEFAASFTVLSGLLGAVIGPALLRGVGIRSDLAVGLGVGTAAHGIGTSSVIRTSAAQGAAAGLAMALNGIVTSLLIVPLYGVLRG